MNCPKCGAVLDEGSKFCAYCGTELITAQEETRLAPSASAKPGKKTVILAAVTALIVLAALAIAFFTSRAGGDSDPMAQCNFNNGGLMAYDDDTLYFVASFVKNKQGTCVYSTSYDGTNKTLISDDPNIGGIRLVNGKIMYLAPVDGTIEIGFMEKDGSNAYTAKTLELGEDDRLYEANASDTTLYYLMNTELRSCSLNGENDTLLLDGVKDFILEGNMLYYATETSINSYRINNGKSREICQASGNSLVFSDGRLYFYGDGGIYSVSVKGDEAPKQLVDDADVIVYVINGDEIDFVDMYDQAERISFVKQQYGEANSEYEVLFTAAGPIKRIPIEGGSAEYLNEKLPIATQIFSYPEGMYLKVSLFVDDLVAAERD